MFSNKLYYYLKVCLFFPLNYKTLPEVGCEFSLSKHLDYKNKILTKIYII